nr:hypothetical protein [Tanacetum cinerariifolium]
MALTFADTHNMIAYLTKSDASEGFDQIIDFLNASSIKYALTVNPNIYVSCIKQFWTSVLVKKVNDVPRLLALVYKKKVIITKTIIRDALRLDDADGIDCLPNKEIFIELSRMGGRREMSLVRLWLQLSSAFPQVESLIFSSAAKVNVDDIPAADVADEGVAGVADEGAAGVAVDDVPAAVDKPSIPSPTSPTQPPPPSQDLLSTSHVQPTPTPSPIAQPPSPQQQPQPSHDAEISMDLLHTLLDTCTTLTRRVEHLEKDKIAQILEITKLKQRVKKLKRRNKLKVSKLKRLKKDVADIAKEVFVDAEIKEGADVQGRQAESQAQIYQFDLEHVDKLVTEVVTVASATITAADTPIPAATITAAAPTLTTAPRIMVHEPKPLKKKTHIEQDEAYARELEAELNKNIDWDEKLDEEVEELRKHLQIVSNEDDDVYTEATPLALKVPIVDYEIYTENNKPYYKIKRADGTHQLYLSFLSMLRNFDREDLEVLWKLVKERFASSKPRNFSNDFLLTTFGAMFKKLYV